MEPTLANKFTEVIFLGLPGSTHHYGGLSADNLASGRNRGNASSPKEAALQVLSLARTLLSLGMTVGILPPQLRPDVKELKRYFSGDDESIITQAAKQSPALLEAVSSSSAMWVANAATIAPLQDCADGKLHITVANLHTNLHRRIEAFDTYFLLRQIFAKVPACVVDMPLDALHGHRDEGAANHMRLAPSPDAPGLHVFVYGADENPRDPKTARQNLNASQALIEKHHLSSANAICVKQSPTAIEQGVFHNDVIAISHNDFLLVHEDAYVMGKYDLQFIADSYAELTGQALNMRIVTHQELSFAELVDTYFFNSQIVSLEGGGMSIIAPTDVQDLHDGKALALLEKIAAEPGNPIQNIQLVDLRQSMKNGGGPACLRLRVPMRDDQLEALRAHNRVLIDTPMLHNLEEAVRRTYPETLYPSDINYELYLKCKEALHALGICLGLELLPAATNQEPDVVS